MFLDLAEESPHEPITVDLCIIGGGAAGIAIAQYFCSVSTTTCLVESGSLKFEGPTQDLYAGRSIGKEVHLTAGRLRYFGGTTNHWGGRCAPLSEDEIAARPWIPYSGWPLGLDDLAPYYQRARDVCGLEPKWQPNDVALRAVGSTAPPSLSSEIDMQLWRFARHSGGLYWNFGQAFADQLRQSNNVRVLLHANVTKFTTNEAGTHVTEVLARSLTGRSVTIAAKHFVLATGGIENARLMLLGSDHSPNGFGAGRDQIGRFFMQHPRGPAATLFTTERLAPIQDMFNDFTGPDLVDYEVGVALSGAAQEQQQLLNCSAVFDYHGDPEAGTTVAQDTWRDLLQGQWPDDMGTKVWRIVRDLNAVAANTERRLVDHRHPLLLLKSATIVVDVEQQPDPDSRVSLSADPTQRDALGVPEVVVDWRLSPLEQKTVRYFMTKLGEVFAARGIGRMLHAPWLAEPGNIWQHGLSETFHYMGTTRMSTDPNGGVVDPDCRVHGMDNFFVAGSSVFPTGGHVNPTFTITALALRLADHLKELLAGHA